MALIELLLIALDAGGLASQQSQADQDAAAHARYSSRLLQP